MDDNSNMKAVDGGIYLNVLFFKEANGTWVAQALERDIAAQGPTIDEARLAFERTVWGYLLVDDRLHREPLSGLKPAPNAYWEAFKTVALLRRQKMITPPENSRPPAIPPPYMIESITNNPVYVN